MTAGLLRACGVTMAVGLAVLLPAVLLWVVPARRNRYTAALYSAVCTGLAALAVWLPLVLLAVGPLSIEMPVPAQTTSDPAGQVFVPAAVETPVVTPSAAAITAPKTVPQAPVSYPVGARVSAGILDLVQGMRAVAKTPVVTALAWVWLTGVVVLGVWRLTHWLHWRRQCTRWAQPVTENEMQIFARAVDAQGLTGCALPRLVCTTWVDTPMLTGLLRPVLLLPAKSYDRDTLFLVLSHELQHLRRRDVARQLLYTAAELLHWPNPLVYLLTGAGRRAAEQACDAAVLNAPALTLCSGDSLPEAYAMALLTAAAAAKQKSPAVGLLGRTCHSRRQKRELEKRMKALFDTAPRKNGRVAAALLLTAALLVGLLAGCAANAEKVESMTAPESESLLTQPAADPLPEKETDPVQTQQPAPVQTTPVNSTAAEGISLQSVEITSEEGWAWPIAWGRSITRIYDESHPGMDVSAQIGTPILAARDGVVTEAVYSSRGHGIYVVIDHGDGWSTLYAHCNELAVEQGDAVSAGEEIATVGNTGNSTGPHCHLEFYRDDETVDPAALFTFTTTQPEIDPYTMEGIWLWPVPGSAEIARGFDEEHPGMDIAAPVGTPIVAIGDGIVIMAQEDTEEYGNVVVICHLDTNKYSRYAYCGELLVSDRGRVRAGDVIATVGDSGEPAGPHCHLEIERFDRSSGEMEYIDPRPVFGREPDYGLDGGES